MYVNYCPQHNTIIIAVFITYQRKALTIMHTIWSLYFYQHLLTIKLLTSHGTLQSFNLLVNKIEKQIIESVQNQKVQKSGLQSSKHDKIEVLD